MPDYTSVYTGAEIDGGIAMAAAHASRHATGGADEVTPASIGAVPTSRTVNGHALTGNISITAADAGAVPTTRTVNNKSLASNITLAASDVGAVPTTRTVNSKALSSNITLVASDVSAVPIGRTVNNKSLGSDITLTASDVGAVPTTRKVNNKALSSDITLTASDVSAVPTTRTVNSKALSSNISLTYSDVSAVPADGSKVQADYASSTIKSTTSNYTLVLTDAGCLIKCGSSSNRTITIPANADVAFPTGTEIEIARYGTGTVTISGATGVTVRSANSLNTISSQYATVGIKKMDTNEWLLSGSLA